MKLDEHTAVVDNDFLSHIAETNISDERLVELLQIVFSDLDLTAVMHPLVYENELLDTSRIRLLFRENIVQKAEFIDIFQGDPARKTYYIQLVRNLYHSLMGEDLPVTGDEVLTYWPHRNSLGEVHSFSMCMLCGCAIFLSDDKDSKVLRQILEQMSIASIDVYSRKEFIDKHMAEGTVKLNHKERKALSHSTCK